MEGRRGKIIIERGNGRKEGRKVVVGGGREGGMGGRKGKAGVNQKKWRMDARKRCEGVGGREGETGETG